MLGAAETRAWMRGCLPPAGCPPKEGMPYALRAWATPPKWLGRRVWGGTGSTLLEGKGGVGPYLRGLLLCRLSHARRGLLGTLGGLGGCVGGGAGDLSTGGAEARGLVLHGCFVQAEE